MGEHVSVFICTNIDKIRMKKRKKTNIYSLQLGQPLFCVSKAAPSIIAFILCLVGTIERWKYGLYGERRSDGKVGGEWKYAMLHNSSCLIKWEEKIV